MEKYLLGKEIGKGAYATIYLAQNKLTGKFVALKTSKLERTEGLPASAIREIALMKALSHPNILTLLEVIVTKLELIIVFEYMPGGDLHLEIRRCSKEGSLGNPARTRAWLSQLLSAVAFMHSKKIVHRDIKTHNILVDGNKCLRLADFGLARTATTSSKTCSSEVVTLWYRAPELLFGATKYSSEIDIWSLGCVFAEMLLGKTLFQGRSVEDQLKEIFSLLGTPSRDEAMEILQNLPQSSEEAHRPMTRSAALALLRQLRFPSKANSLLGGMSEAEAELLLRLLALSPKRRCTALEALEAPYFTGEP